MSELPTGTVTFLFTDIEGSTRLLQRLGPEYTQLLDDHCRLIRGAVDKEGGVVVSTEGDSFFVVFRSAPSALNAAAAAQLELASAPWPGGEQVKVRMGLHTGEGALGGDNYAGIDVHRASRITSSGHGGQILVSATTRTLAQGHLPEGARLQDLGLHRLKDLETPEQIFQFAAEGLASDFPPIRSLSARPNNLPPQLTSFVGRQEEISRVRALLQTTRLLTLTGPGGTGKTRLSLAVANDVLGDFSDGVFFVPLATITDPALIPATIALALGLQESPTKPIFEILEEHLAPKSLLLVIDNFEQVVSGAAWVSQLLGAAPKVKALVSSREVLRLNGEQEYSVPPLALPDFRNLPPLEALTQFEAVALFIQRGTSVKPGFRVTNENAPAVAEICTRLDGLPLAIELAAARLKVLTPQAILDRLQRSLNLLTGGSTDLPTRQQTLRNAIAWSYDLLDPADKSLFRRLSVFVGGWTFEDAEAVCNPNQSDDLDTIDALSSLVDKSLVRQHEDRHGDSRFMMLETIREFGAERLEDEEDSDEIHRRHAEVYMRVCEEAEPNFLGADQERWLNRIEDEHDNIRAALRWSLDSAGIQTALRIGGAIWRFWHLRGMLREGRQWMTDLLAPPAAARDAPRAKASNALGSLAYWQGDYDTARKCYEQSLEIYREMVNEAGIAETLYNLAYTTAIEKDFDKARRLYEECRELNIALENAPAAAYANFGIAMVDWLSGNASDSWSRTEDNLEIFSKLGDKFGIANSLAVLARLKTEEADYAEARKYFLEALPLFQEIGDLTGVAAIADDVAIMLARKGRAQEAVLLGGGSEAMKQEIGGRAPPELSGYKDPWLEVGEALTEKEKKDLHERGLSMSSEQVAATLLAALQSG